MAIPTWPARRSPSAPRRRLGRWWNSWPRMAPISSRFTRTSPGRPTSRSSTRPGAGRSPWTVTFLSASLPKRPPPPASARSSIRRPSQRVAPSRPRRNGDVRALYDTRDPAACASAFEAYRHNGVAVTADLLVYHHIVHAEQILSDTGRMRHVPDTIRRNWENLLKSETTRELQSILRPIPPLELQNVRLANEAGVVLLAATDVDIPLGVPGLSLHEELLRLVEAGLTPLAALQAATRNPAQVLGLADSLGRIEPGKLADLVLLDAD